MDLAKKQILFALEETAKQIQWNKGFIEILLIGGAAAVLNDLLPPERTTQDCDIMNYCPQEAQEAVLAAGDRTAQMLGLPKNWLNSRAMQLNVLPDGWHARRIFIGQFGYLKVFAAGRLDLLGMKFFANRPQDREDIINMKPTKREMEWVRRYLDLLRLPSREADLDQVQSALRLADAMEELFHEC